MLSARFMTLFPISESTKNRDEKLEHDLNYLQQADKTVNGRPTLKSELFEIN